MEIVCEEWRDIENYEGLYKVSNTGKVFDCAKNKDKGTNYVSGYKYISLRKTGSVKSIAVHRLVAKAFIPNPEGLPIINHKDLDRANNFVDNLEWITYKGNSAHYQEEKRKGNIAKDKNYNGHIKVYFDSDEQVEEITKLAKAQGSSASGWFRVWALKQIKRRGK